MTDLREALEAILHEYRTAGHHGADGIDVIASIAIEALAATPKLSNDFRLATDQLPYAKGPYSYEYIAARPDDCRWRIRDTNDNAVGSAATEVGAKAAVALLNFAANPPSPTPPAGAAEVRELVPRSEKVTLADCDSGLFLYGDTLALKSEYENNEGRIDAYIVASGEFFWGPAPQTIASQRALLVTPMDVRKALSATVPDDGWRPASEAPERTWLLTYLEGEDRPTISCLVRDPDGNEEWIAEDGRTTVTHHSYAAPTHFRPLPPPPGQGEKP